MAEKEESKEYSRELLSLHETVSRFAGVVDMPCRHMTSLCPDKCNHGGPVAVFDVEEYRKYEKPGKYGDAQASKFHVKLSDSCQPKSAIECIGTLEKGQMVKLNWNHDYVTCTSSGGKFSSKYPERPITLLEIIP
mmetsp:Transcript_8953/g.23449  ORF Transcript_8953/g.23449 Transcript_8953/m.23449 type:complete len:135 (-) Transcript_8953:74-478(-)